MTDSMTPAEAAARGLQGLRRHHGITQGDVVRAARLGGLKWSRSTVANIEQGRHEMKLVEAAVLIAALREHLHLPVTVADLLPDDGAIDAGQHAVPTDALRAVLTDPAEYDRWAGSRRGAQARRALSAAGDAIDAMLGVWPDASTRQLREAEAAAYGVSEQNAADRLGVSPLVLSAAAHRLWGRSLTAERDRRADERTPEDASRQQVRAIRGHVTRDLIDDLRPVLTPDE